mmetsp:Transcript_1749/g.10774  ORF Transcript_1749/g.10774 Transcript_1749/m.10774 type:complete len:92 (+) Transcript_1749:335-610(+)
MVNKRRGGVTCKKEWRAFLLCTSIFTEVTSDHGSTFDFRSSEPCLSTCTVTSYSSKGRVAHTQASIIALRILPEVSIQALAAVLRGYLEAG